MSYQKNLKFLLDRKVNGKQYYKIIDGIHYPNSEAHVFHYGHVKDNEGAMDAIKDTFCDWYIENKNIVKSFYESKK